jgi:DNA-binding CsgD family transcriptional regulator
MTISMPVRASATETRRERALGTRLAAEIAAEHETPADLAQALLSLVLDEIPSAGGVLPLMHPHTGLFWTGAVTTLPAASCHPFFTVEVEGASEHCFRRLASTGARARATRLRVGRSDPLVSQVLDPFGFSDELRVVCRDGSVAWGGLSLWRTSGTYTEADERLLDSVADPIGGALRGAVLRSLDDGLAGAGSTGVLVVEDGRVTEVSREGTDFLRELAEPGLERYHQLEHLVALATADPRFSTVLATDDGRWISAHGSELGPGRVAITLLAASPHDLFGARVAGAGLSEREIEVTRLVCRGLADQEIARDLGVSPHTARDHVKAVRRKLGVRSRAEVAALVFADHYLDAFLDTAAVSHGPS